jgi:hypothetical protein
VATLWRDEDIPLVVLAARLFEAARTGDVRASAELRMWTDRLGLTPLARLRNRVVVEQPSDDLTTPDEPTVVRLADRRPS